MGGCALLDQLVCFQIPCSSCKHKQSWKRKEREKKKQKLKLSFVLLSVPHFHLWEVSKLDNFFYSVHLQYQLHSRMKCWQTPSSIRNQSQYEPFSFQGTQVLWISREGHPEPKTYKGTVGLKGMSRLATVKDRLFANDKSAQSVRLCAAFTADVPCSKDGGQPFCTLQLVGLSLLVPMGMYLIATC